MKKYIHTHKLNSGWPDPSGPSALATQRLKEEMHRNSLDALALKKSKYSKLKKNRSKERNKRKKARVQRLEGFSKQLENNLPKSEVWFRDLYIKEVFDKRHNNPFFCDKFNESINNKYIPDVSNRGYRYIIEIDGSWHDQLEAQRYDDKRDYYFKKRGYEIIRIKAYDLASYTLGMDRLRAHLIKMDATY